MNNKANILNNDSGSTILLAVVFLMLATVMGMAIMNTSTMEIRISGSYKTIKSVFYAADSGIHYVAVNPNLYGSDNLDPAQPLNFPDPANPATTYPITRGLNVGGTVTYDGKTQLPVGSGFSAGQIMAIRYQIQSTGRANNGANNDIRAGFYRIGL